MNTSRAIATLVTQMTPPNNMLNSDAILMWKLEKAAELAALSVLGMKYKEFTYNRRDW